MSSRRSRNIRLRHMELERMCILYEMGELVREHNIENGYDEVKALYPELDYWRQYWL